MLRKCCEPTIWWFGSEGCGTTMFPCLLLLLCIRGLYVHMYLVTGSKNYCSRYAMGSDKSWLYDLYALFAGVPCLMFCLFILNFIAITFVFCDKCIVSNCIYYKLSILGYVVFKVVDNLFGWINLEDKWRYDISTYGWILLISVVCLYEKFKYFFRLKLKARFYIYTFSSSI